MTVMLVFVTFKNGETYSYDTIDKFLQIQYNKLGVINISSFLSSGGEDNGINYRDM